MGVCSPHAESCRCRHMYKLLRCTCLHCFALKMDADEVARYRRRLELLAEGRLVEAAEQVSGGGALAARVRQTAASSSYLVTLSYLLTQSQHSPRWTA